MLQFLHNWVSKLFYQMKRLPSAWMLFEFLKLKKKNNIYLLPRGVIRTSRKDIAVSGHNQFCDDEYLVLFKFVQAQYTPIYWLWRYQTSKGGEVTATERKRQKINRFILVKQQLCTCITLFCTFLSRRNTTTTWIFRISRVRFIN